jgi:C_GCAxxG_C_C family probable redox protein
VSEDKFYEGENKMSLKAEKALENHKKGYNCAQSVACAFCREADMDEQTMFRVTEGHGLGMGGMQGTCGAVTGAVAVLGAMNSCGDLENPMSKANTYKLSRELVKRFQEKNGVITCKELKGIETGKVARSCPGCVADAAEILEDILKENK